MYHLYSTPNPLMFGFIMTHTHIYIYNSIIFYNIIELKAVGGLLGIRPQVLQEGLTQRTYLSHHGAVKSTCSAAGVCVHVLMSYLILCSLSFVSCTCTCNFYWFSYTMISTCNCVYFLWSLYILIVYMCICISFSLVDCMEYHKVHVHVLS